MLSVAVAFDLEFPTTRRQLQTSAIAVAITDPASPVFQFQLRSAVAETLPTSVGIENVLVATTSNPRVLTVTIIGFATISVTPSEVVTTTSAARFVADIGSLLGTTPTMSRAPGIMMRTTSVPSPPPSTPPSPPHPPPATPLTEAYSHANNLGASSSGSTSLSQEMIWVIIIAVIAVIVVCGCAGAFLMGKRSRKPTATVQIGRPALRRQVSPEEANAAAANAVAANAAAASSADVNLPSTGVRPFQDVRLIELGMAVQRSMERQPSGGASPAGTPGASGHGGMSDADIQLKLDGLQAAIDDVRESLSPGRGLASSSPARSPRGTIETRIRSMPSSSADLHI